MRSALTVPFLITAVFSASACGVTDEDTPAADAPGASAEAAGATAPAPTIELTDVEIEGVGTVRLPPEHTVLEQAAASDENYNIASSSITVGEGDEMLTIRTEATSGRIGVTDEATARTIGVLLTRGEIQDVSALEGGNFMVHSIRESTENFILVANNDAYIRCSTTSVVRLALCREIAGSLESAP